MNLHRNRFGRILVLTSMLASSAAFGLDVTFPPETATYQPSQLPGYQLVQRNCMTCHSAQYAQSQPPASPRAYWEATVKKMKKPFGAQFADEDIPAMVDYLTKTYGAERTIGAAASQPMPVVRKAEAVQAVAPANAQALVKANNCTACHAVDGRIVGPSFKEVVLKYTGKEDAVSQIARNIRAGGAGKWGPVPMPPFEQLSDAEASALARYVLSQ